MIDYLHRKNVQSIKINNDFDEFRDLKCCPSNDP